MKVVHSRCFYAEIYCRLHYTWRSPRAVRHLGYPAGPRNAQGPDPGSRDCDCTQTTDPEPEAGVSRGCLSHPDLLFRKVVPLTPRDVCRSDAGSLLQI
ncbi:MAG: hypothetical protein ACFFD2_09380 [Promethearchaeota archaeon]